MLARWTLKNFKSFHTSEPLTIAPLTLLCGANSSGKSSVLQSMLLIKQTFEHSPSERVVALNGPLVQLGTFTDILNYQAKASSESSIELGWKLDHRGGDQQSSAFFPGDAAVETSCIDFKFDTVGPANERSTLELQPDLNSARMTALLVDHADDKHNLNIQIDRVIGRGRKIQYDSSSLGDQEQLRFRVNEIDAESRDSALPAYVTAKVVGAQVHHFAPNSLIVRYDRHLRMAKQAASSISELGSARRFRLSQLSISDNVLAIIADAVRPLAENPRYSDSIEKLISPQTEVMTVEMLHERFRQTSIMLRRAIREALSSVENQISRAIHNELKRDNTLAFGRVDAITRVTTENERYFRFFLRYLGPLRADPRPLYPLQALSSPTDVGPKGEQTAAVLHLNAERKIQTITSSAFEGSPTESSSTESTLAFAVADWLKYLGVADDFETVEKGKLGHELRVRTAGVSEFQDLTNVGVGVSQVLPIVVTCLLAAPRSTIILEQPELHLHPAVQARLADFFIAMTLLNKQCIIETHSEHLIERIRFRVVQDRTDAVRNNTRIYFFSKDSGSTSVKDIVVNKYGSIDDWPKDFFDQSQIANEKIVLMALKRHKDETEKASN
jgi:predicted ATPase